MCLHRTGSIDRWCRARSEPAGLPRNSRGSVGLTQTPVSSTSGRDRCRLSGFGPSRQLIEKGFPRILFEGVGKVKHAPSSFGPIRPMMRDFETSGRSLVVSRHGMAATSHPLSTLAAIDVLRQGGNALDAAVAACAVQCVVEPESTGIGGDCFALLAPRGGSKLIAYNGSGRAPAAATTAWYAEQGIAKIERQSAHAVTVPGAVEAWSRLLADHGTMSLGEVLQPAVALARDGYPIAPRVNRDWTAQAALLRKDANAAGIFLPDGNVPGIGTIHRQLQLAETLEAIATIGERAFYEGRIAADMVDYLRSIGGLHTLDDFAATRGEYVEPISANFRGHDIWECPPNGQGAIALLILNILSRFEAKGDPLAIDRLHIEVEATRLAYAIRNDFLADPAQAEVPLG